MSQRWIQDFSRRGWGGGGGGGESNVKPQIWGSWIGGLCITHFKKITRNQ